MATRSYVLIETAVGKTRDVVTALRQVKGVTNADVVTGPHDVIAILETDDLNAVGNLVTGSVHTISGITRTVTCLVVSA